MDEELKKKYTKFVLSYIASKKVCLNQMMIKHGYDEKFFDDAVKDGILKEINENDIKQRVFKFTELAKQF